VLMRPEGLALFRMVIAESPRFPALGKAVFRAGPEAAAKVLAQYLKGQVRAGVIVCPDPDLSARHFLEIVTGDLHMRALMIPGQPPTAAERKRCVVQAVTTILDGLRPRP